MSIGISTQAALMFAMASNKYLPNDKPIRSGICGAPIPQSVLDIRYQLVATEYELIQRKVSKLSANKRKALVLRYKSLTAQRSAN